MASGSIDSAAVEAALTGFPDPETGRDIVQQGQIKNIETSGSSLSLTLALTSHSAPLAAETREALQKRLQEKLPQATDIAVNLGEHHRPPGKLGEIGLAAKSVIAIGSGKGGVGKSTIATSIALGLSRAGCRVGLLDADIYGPSIPHLLGISARPEDVQGDNQLRPIEKDGVSVMSIGFLIEPDQAVVWRGPMLHKMLGNFLGGTCWGELDYLIIDMPPGTGDVALSLSQMLPQTGAVVVCTPQDVALLDAVKAIGMLKTVNIPILGMVENMSGFICDDCGKRHDIFGRGGAKRRSEELGVPFLGEVPLNLHLRTAGDSGQTASIYDDPIIAPYLEKLVNRLARRLADSAAEQPPMPSLPVLG